ncbi:MAG: hypothetical protein H7319_21610 [Spirosoma sp.]|nr:hypothetical protein [Spirosoma sp.]
MRIMFKLIQRPALLLIALTTLVCSTASINLPATRQSNKKTITIKNTTKFGIDNIYLSPDEEEHWGEDLLGENEILKPGATIEVEVDCGKWDVRLVAEDESDCQIEDVTLCNADTWNVVADC